jgi:IS605 OrfB family transposase
MTAKKEPNVFNKTISNKYSIPSSLTKHQYETNSWFDAFTYEGNGKSNPHKYKIPDKFTMRGCTRIELFPTKKQKGILHQWEDIYIFFYNKAISYIKETKDKFSLNDIQLYIKYRHIYKKWIKSIKFPTGAMCYAIKDAYTAYKTNIKLVQFGNKKRFNLRYKKITNPRKIIKFDKHCFSTAQNAIIPTILGEMETSLPIKGNDKTSTYHHNKVTGKYYLYVPYKKDSISIKNNNDYCGIDPGQRTFITGFGVSKDKNQVFEFGCNTNSELEKIKNRIETTKRRRRKRQLYDKYTRKITDLHYKTIAFITANYNNVVIGRLSTSDIVQSNKLAKKVKYSILNLSHFLFRQRLQYKCQSKGLNYYEIDEAYTSKSCTQCGNIKNDLGSSKHYKCENCNLEIDRDINGARNILIKFFNLKRLERLKKKENAN